MGATCYIFFPNFLPGMCADQYNFQYPKDFRDARRERLRVRLHFCSYSSRMSMFPRMENLFVCLCLYLFVKCEAV